MADYSMEEIKNIVRSIAISGGARGLSVKMLADDFKKMEGFDLPYQRLGFRAPDEFLRSLNDTVTVTGYGSSALVEPVVTHNTRHVRELVKKNNSKSNPRKWSNKSYSSSAYRSPPEYKSDYGRSNNQSYNRSGASNGSWNPSSNYNRPTNKDPFIDPRDDSRKVINREFDFQDTVDPDENGFASSDEDLPRFVLTGDKKLAQVQDSLQQMKITSPPTTKAPPKEQKLTQEQKDSFQQMTISAPPTRASKSRLNEAIPDGAVLALINCLEIPEGAMNLTDTIETQKIPAGIVPKQSVQMFVTEVHNPNRFWYHMGENASKIDELMNDIDDYYSHLEREEWRVKPSSVAVGLYCMAKFSGVWHRAKIVNDLTHGKVKVFYIDYGTVAELELKDVKFMAKCFASMPAQAMRASLAYVKPVDHRWTRDSAWAMLSLVYEKILYAYVVDVDREQNFLDVVLIDTTGSSDSIVNQQLFFKGHAIWESDVPYKEKSTENFRKRTKSFSERFPRFDELENGTYPSLQEISELNQKRFNCPGYYMQSLQDDNDFEFMLALAPTPTAFADMIPDKDACPYGFENDYFYEEDVYFYENPYVMEYSPESREAFDDGPTQVMPEVEYVVPEAKPRKPKKQVRFMDPEREIIAYDQDSPIVGSGAYKVESSLNAC